MPCTSKRHRVLSELGQLVTRQKLCRYVSALLYDSDDSEGQYLEEEDMDVLLSSYYVAGISSRYLFHARMRTMKSMKMQKVC